MGRTLANIFLFILALNTLWFVAHAGRLGLEGLTTDLSAESRLWHADAHFATAALFLHMVLGAILTVGAPVQAMPFVRQRLPGLHRRFGYVLAGLAVMTGMGGLVYIAAKGTVGGAWMSVAFAAYGALMILSAVNTVYHAIAKDSRRHSRWAARLVILAVGSWIYRMHYGLWYMATGGAGSTEAFDGPFDLVTVWAFFVPYLLAAELVFAIRDRRRAKLGKSRAAA
jgi:hypothetical protein